MDEYEWLAERFEAERSHLRAVAYRMLGSQSEADDAVQESWLRLSRSDTSSIENLGGWLTTVIARVCLDMLRSRESRREESLDEDVSDPHVNREGGIDPERLTRQPPFAQLTTRPQSAGKRGMDREYEPYHASLHL